MKNSLIIWFAALCLLLSSCSVTYLITSSGESFEALTKITDDKKISFSSVGGDNNKNLLYSAREDDGTSNIYFKDNVLSSAITQKTFGSNYCYSPDFCQATNRVVYSSYSNGQFDIFFIDAFKGRVQTQVTSTSENEYNPCWSTDGKYIVFEKGVSPRNLYVIKSNNNSVKYINLTENQIWLKNLETGELQLIGNGSFPRFSHDNKQISFVKYELNKSKKQEIGTIWIMEYNGENQKQITGTNMGYASCPTWSPDDKNLVFQMMKTNQSGNLNSDSNNDIYTISLNGEDLRQHTTNISNDCAAYWTSDNYIYFTSDRGAIKNNFKIWRFKINQYSSEMPKNEVSTSEAKPSDNKSDQIETKEYSNTEFDEIIKTDGTILKGKIFNSDNDKVYFKMMYRDREVETWVEKEKIKKIRYRTNN